MGLFYHSSFFFLAAPIETYRIQETACLHCMRGSFALLRMRASDISTRTHAIEAVVRKIQLAVQKTAPHSQVVKFDFWTSKNEGHREPWWADWGPLQSMDATETFHGERHDNSVRYIHTIKYGEYLPTL